MADQASPKLPGSRYTIGRRMYSAVVASGRFLYYEITSTRERECASDQPDVEIIYRNIHLPSGHDNCCYNRCMWSLLLASSHLSSIYCDAGGVVYSRNALGQWSSNSCLPQQPHELCSNKIIYRLNGKSNVPRPQRHRIVDAALGRDVLVVV